MDRIVSCEQYNHIVDRAADRRCGLTNCYFLPSAIQQKVEDGKLYWQDVPDGLLLLDDNGAFYRCYYYLAEDARPEGVTLDKDAVIEFPFSGEMNDRQRRQVGMIEAMGFRLGRESGMMSASPDAVIAVSGEQASPCVAAQASDAAGITALISACFNPLYAFLPTGEELDAMIDRNAVLVIREGNEVAAALISSFEKRIATVNQVAVDPACRRRGYARMLMQAYHGQYADRAAAFRHWVDINNVPAVNMYRGLGYGFNLRRANEYILIQRKENDQ